MQKRKEWISLGLSFLLAFGTLLTPVSAAQDFTDGSEVLEEFQAQEELTAEDELEEQTETAQISEGSFSDGEAQEGLVQMTESTTVNAEAVPDNDELFGGYANRFFYEEEQSSAPASSIGETALSGVSRSIYDEMKAKIITIAAKGGSTAFEIKTKLNLKWTTSTYADIRSEVDKKFKTLNTDKIITCLLADCPYELYWYEKTQQTMWYYSYSINESGNKATVQIQDLFVYMPVCDAYASSTYKVNSKMVKTAKAAAANAKSIVDQYKKRSELEKLVAYKKKICSLTDYNEWYYMEDYGDPWQLIWVFDGDASTKVVCEGYSKAFQYLCDLSGITCYTVTGKMSDGVGSGDHMWNIVKQGSRYYIADITNSDNGTLGDDGEFFLTSPYTGKLSKGYIYKAKGYDVCFSYDTQTKNVYGTGSKSVLKMTKDKYEVDSTAYKPAKTSITGISNKTSNKLTLTWKKATKAKGYYIYCRVGTKGSYKKIATVKSGSTVKYTHSKLKKGTKYYYKVRSYSYDILGNKVYSAWSSVKSQTAK